MGLPAVRAARYEKVVNGPSYDFEWDDAKAAANERKRDITFELAPSIL